MRLRTGSTPKWQYGSNGAVTGPTAEPSSQPTAPLPGRRRRSALAGSLPWRFLSRISPARRVALAVVALFDLVEVVLLSTRGFEQHNLLALVLGFAVLILLLGFELAEHIALKRDRDLSQEISEWLLPHAAPSLAGVEVAYSSRMANHVGSDYFNVFPRLTSEKSASSHRVFIVMADVAGTGLQGALLMATFQASLRVLADSRIALCEVASQLSQWSWDRSLEGRHFTMAFLADLDPETGSLDYVSAGHQPPMIRRVDGGIERLELRGFPLGALPNSLYEMGTAAMAAGDILVVFTDGVVSAENSRGEQFGEDRVTHLLRVTRGFTANETANQLGNSLLSFCGSVRQADDLSFLVVRRC